MKKLFFLACFAALGCAAIADQTADIKAGTDLAMRNVGGTLVADVAGVTKSYTLAASPLAHVAKPANSFVFTEDLYALDPALGVHSTVTFTGSDYAANILKWTITDTPIIGTTVTVNVGGTNYTVKVTGFSGAIYQNAEKLPQPLYETFDNIYRGTGLNMVSSLVSSITITGTYSGVIPISLTISPQLAGIGGVAVVTPPFVRAIQLDAVYFTTGSTHTITVILNENAPQNETVALAGGVPLSGPPSVLVPIGKSSATFTVTTGSGLTAQVPTWITATLNGYKADAAVTAGPMLLSVSQVGTALLYSGGVAQFQVNLSAPAPSGGAVISLRSDTPNSQLVPTITIPAGKSTGVFNVYSPVVQTSNGISYLDLTAAYAGATVRNTFVLH